MNTALPPPDEYEHVRCLPIPEAARLLGVSQRTVYRMIAAGELRPIVIWSKPRLPLSELRRYVDARTCPIFPVTPRAIEQRRRIR